MAHLGLDTLQRFGAGALDATAHRRALQHAEACAECRQLLLELVRDRAADDAPTALPTAPAERYIVEGVLGRGGVGIVHRAIDRPLGRTIALKELSAPGPAARERFLREALITAGLQHPGIVPIFDVAHWTTGEPFYTMKLVGGQTLRALLEAAGSLETRLALLPNLIAACEALAYAHARGVIHRDVKPANILVGEFGETLVIDWGLAKQLGAADASAGAGAPIADDASSADALVGTLRYMAPEQARRVPADLRSDVYALGVVLYELLAGRSPYALDGDTAALIDRVAAARVRPLPADVPRDLVVIALRALALDPAARYASAKELVDDLKRFSTGQLVSARAYSTWALVARQARRHARSLALAGVALAAILAVLVGAIVRVSRERGAAQRSLARVELDQARHVYLAGDIPRAGAFVAASLRDDGDEPVARYLAARTLGALGGRGFDVLAHRGGVVALDVAPDGGRLATAGTDGVVRIWDVATGARVRELAGHRGSPVAAVFDPAGARLVVATRAGDLRVWDLATGRAASERGTPGTPWSGVGFGPDGAILAWSGDGTVALWSGDGRPMFRIAIAGGLGFAAITPDGARIVTASSADGLVIRRAMDGGERCRVPLSATAVWLAAALAPAGDRVAVAIGARPVVRIFASTDCRELASIAADVGEAYPPVFDPAGRRLAVSGTHGVTLIDTANVDPPRRLESAAYAHPLRFAPDGRRVAVASLDGRVTIDAVTGHRLAGLVGSKVTRAIAWAPGGEALYGGTSDGRLIAWRTPADAHGAPPPPVVDLKVQRDGSLLAISETGDVLRADSHLHDWRVVLRAACPLDGLTSLRGYDRCIAADNGTVLRNLGDRAEVIAEDGRVVSRLELPRIQTIVLGPGGRLAAARSVNGSIVVWDSRSGRVVRRFSPGPDVIASVGFVDDERLAIGDRDGATVWDIATGRRVFAIASPALSSWVLVAAGRDRMFSTGGIARDPELRDARTGELVAVLDKGPLVLAASFDPAGRLLATTDSDDRVRLWDAASGRLVDVLELGRDPVVAWVGDHLVATNGDGERRELELGFDNRPAAEILADLDAMFPLGVEDAALTGAAR